MFQSFLWLSISLFFSSLALAVDTPEVAEETVLVATESFSAFSRAMQGGPVVSMVLFSLITLSVLAWALLLTKWYWLHQMKQKNEIFIDHFWKSQSLRDLHQKIDKEPHSPVREVFREAYIEMTKHPKPPQGIMAQALIQSAMDSLRRTLAKSRRSEQQRMEKYLPFLATTASASPFIGLFGTVWGIMDAFDTIARTGSSSLASVAPGISEALIATAFGLAAAIPAVIGYNIARSHIRLILENIDGFGSDFLNIVERHLVAQPSSSERTSSQTRS
ncbi:MAG: MotA/TolQ/ExbB proton channel family protein [Oligoflexales bacterium]